MGKGELGRGGVLGMVDGGVRGNRCKYVIKGSRNSRRKYGWKGVGGNGKRRSRKKGNYGGGGGIVVGGREDRERFEAGQGRLVGKFMCRDGV